MSQFALDPTTLQQAPAGMFYWYVDWTGVQPGGRPRAYWLTEAEFRQKFPTAEPVFWYPDPNGETGQWVIVETKNGISYIVPAGYHVADPGELTTQALPPGYTGVYFFNPTTGQVIIPTSSQQKPPLGFVGVDTALNADFVITVVPGMEQTVNFMNMSHGTYISSEWDFGDTTKSTIKDPQHIYTTGGNYTVTLKITDGTQTSTKKSVLAVAHQTAVPVTGGGTTVTAPKLPGGIVQPTKSESDIIIKWVIGGLAALAGVYLISRKKKHAR